MIQRRLRPGRNRSCRASPPKPRWCPLMPQGPPSLPCSLALHAPPPRAHTDYARAVQVTCTKVVFPDPAIPNTKRHTGVWSGAAARGSAAAAGAAIFPLAPPALPPRRGAARAPGTAFRAASAGRTGKAGRRGAGARSCPARARVPTSGDVGAVEVLGRPLEGDGNRDAQRQGVGPGKAQAPVAPGAR